MQSLIYQIANFLEPVGMGVILIYFYGFLVRKEPSEQVMDLSLGFVFGLAAVMAMTDPIEISQGIIVDMRNLFVGLAAAFFGRKGGIIALAMAVFVRIEIGGEGVFVGIIGACMSSVMGLAWARFVRPRIKDDFIALPILAAMISAHIFASAMLPKSVMIQYFQTYAPVLIVLNFICTSIFGKLLYRERGLHHEKAHLYAEAHTDQLTKICNRKSALNAYTSMQAKAAPNRGIAMTCIDIDKFKTINDTYGHLAGDQVLKEVATRIGTCLRHHDIYCRLSGDEFLFVLINATSEEARQITERCRSVIARVPITCDGNSMKVSISLGTVWSPCPIDFEDFRSRADDALYAAKRGGRNQVAFDRQFASSNAA